ncbi:hypothetical protein [Streptomyces sp. NPDC040750]|uniref:hypothetical protein n=1 Tax=Streptomyces sp. NPDC040750 TaxID=3154491 RepID=UPI0033CC84A7
MEYTITFRPSAGRKQTGPGLTDYGRPPGRQKTYAEHDYTAVGSCRRCGNDEQR